jgi:DNA-binding CsgD family transcriptional regulator
VQQVVTVVGELTAPCLRAVVLEREGAMAAVADTLDSAAGGGGRALFVVGEAGLGKTSILETAVERAGDRFRVAVGRGGFAEAGMPFGVMTDALVHLRGGRVLESLTEPAGAGGVVATSLYAILRWIQQLADESAVLIALDDLHSADPDSLALLRLLCPRLAPLPIAIVATTRPWPEPALRMAEDLVARGLAGMERLAPLSATASGSLLRDRSGFGVPAPLLEQALGACGGNPLLLEHAGDGLRRGEVVGSLPGRADLRLLLVRFVIANENERRLLQAASVLGVRFRASVAEAMVGLSGRESTAALEGLTRAGLIGDGGAGWAHFSHELVRQAVYDELGPLIRTQLHRLAFRTLFSRGSANAEAAGHAAPGGLAGDAEAVTALSMAGRTALRAGSVKVARRHLEVAAALAGEPVPDEVLVDLGRALLWDGDSDGAAEVCDRVVGSAGASRASLVAALGLLGRAGFHTGDFGRAQACFAATTRLAEGHTVQLGLGALLDQTFLTWAHLGPVHARPLAERARQRAAALDADEALRACADTAWALCAHLSGDPAGLGVAELAAGNVGTSPLPSPLDGNWALEPAVVPGDLFVWAERFSDAERLFTRALRDAERRGEPFLDFHASLSWSDGLRRLGRLEEALELANRAVEVSHLVPVTLPLALSARGLALVDLGRLDEASMARTQVAEAVGDGHPWYLASAYELHLAAILAHRCGDAEAACAAYDRLQALLADHGIADPCHIDYARDAIDAYLRCGRRDDVEALLDRLHGNRSLPSRWPSVVATVGRALLADHDGDPDRAATGHDRVLPELLCLPLPLTRAWALTHHGAFLSRRHDQAQNDPAQARTLLAEAATLAEGCGAMWQASWARAEWRRAGGRPKTPPGRLTPQEGAVARLARLGRTNRQIADQLYLSVNTVETHLAHVYRKLGIRRRWELRNLPDSVAS